MIFSMICKLFGHKWRRPTKKERDQYVSDWKTEPCTRICRRCSAERIVKARKTKTKETT